MEPQTIESFDTERIPSKTIKVSYSVNRRQGQSSIAAMYQEVIANHFSLVPDQDEADVVIAHHPPKNYVTSYALHPRLREKHVIACCVPHAESIPRSWISGLRLVQEVWTCSEYCREVLAQYHPNVFCVPYVISRYLHFSQEARMCLERFITYDPNLTYFSCIAPLNEPRKNVQGLVRSFRKVAKSLPYARLVLKASPEDHPTWESDQQILFLPVTIPHEYINALYSLIDVYVSAHHAEAWGLTLSDALLFGKPVIAPEYSGSLDFLTHDNAYLVPVRKSIVPPDAIGVAIEPGMYWATPDEDALADCLVRASEEARNGRAQEKLRAGQETVRRFSHEVASDAVVRRILSAAMRYCGGEQ